MRAQSSIVSFLKAFGMGPAALVLVLLVSGTALSQDIEGSHDHPLVSRLKDFYITNYEEFEFDEHVFYDAEGNEYAIRGRKFIIEYELMESSVSPGQLKIRQNYIDAIRKIGGDILSDRGTMKVVRDNGEIWIDLWVSSDGWYYTLTIVEKTVMKQEVETNSEALAGDIREKGRAAVYGIYFDTDSAVIKSGSEPAITAIAEILNSDKGLKLYVVGHTDWIGQIDYNMNLSGKRAQSVVDMLVTKHGIDKGRLVAKGVGPLSPVATNATEDGRKLNRRVELVAMQ